MFSINLLALPVFLLDGSFPTNSFSRKSAAVDVICNVVCWILRVFYVLLVFTFKGKFDYVSIIN